jgi:hypothetical protein
LARTADAKQKKSSPSKAPAIDPLHRIGVRVCRAGCTWASMMPETSFELDNLSSVGLDVEPAAPRRVRFNGNVSVIGPPL